MANRRNKGGSGEGRSRLEETLSGTRAQGGGGGGDDELADALLEALGIESSPSSNTRGAGGGSSKPSTMAPGSGLPVFDDEGFDGDDDVDVIWDIAEEEVEIEGLDEDVIKCLSCSTSNAVSNRFCGYCGVSLSEAIRLQSAPDPEDLEPQHREPVSVDVRLVSINEDGSDGLEIPLRYTETIVGRRGDTRFPTDAFLSPCHSRLIVDGRRLFIEDLESLNGTYVRIRKEVRLSPGDCFLMGRQVLRFERLEQHIAPKARSKDGTRYMGSPPPLSEYKLLQIGVGGSSQNVYCLPEKGSVLGREKGDIVFMPDRFMSGRHAKIFPGDDGHYYLADLNSSNGTWIRIQEGQQLEDGDLIFLGQQLFRVEGPGLQGLD